MFSGVLHELLVGVPTHNILGTFHSRCLLQCKSAATSETLIKSFFRCRIYRNDRADTDDFCHVAAGKNGRYQRKVVRKLHFLDQLLSRGSAVGSAIVLLRVASQIW